MCSDNLLVSTLPLAARRLDTRTPGAHVSDLATAQDAGFAASHREGGGTRSVSAASQRSQSHRPSYSDCQSTCPILRSLNVIPAYAGIQCLSM
jgi:hypothetical protein